jgi:hypothetical protein
MLRCLLFFVPVFLWGMEFEYASWQPQAWTWSATQARSIQERVKTSTKRGTWNFLKAKHCLVESEAPVQVAAEAAEFVDLVIDRLALVVCPGPDRRKELQGPLTFRLFTNPAAYQAIHPRSPGGVFTSKIESTSLNGQALTRTIRDLYLDVLVSPQASTFAHIPRGILQHETVHFLVQRAVGSRPVSRWLTEGLATYLAEWDLNADNARNIARLANRQGITLGQENLAQWFSRVDAPPNQPARFGWEDYTISAVVVRHLMTPRSATSPPLLQTCISRLREGRDPWKLLDPKEIAELASTVTLPAAKAEVPRTRP